MILKSQREDHARMLHMQQQQRNQQLQHQQHQNSFHSNDQEGKVMKQCYFNPSGIYGPTTHFFGPKTNGPENSFLT